MKQAQHHGSSLRSGNLLSGTTVGRIAGVGLAALATLIAPACSRAGGHSETAGGVDPPATVLEVDFGLRTDLHLGSGFLTDVLAVDLGGDGIADLVEANFAMGKLTIALGNPDGTFLTVYELDTIGHGWQIVSGDFDGDGMKDIGLSCVVFQETGTPGVMAFLQGPGLGEFGTRVHSLAFDGDPMSMGLAVAPSSMVTGDGGPDVMFAALRDDREVVRIELSAGRDDDLVQTGSWDSSSLGEQGSPVTLDVIDIGDDGYLDLVVGEVEVDDGLADRVVAYLTESDDRSFLEPELLLTGLFWPIVENVGDVNGDGFVDLSVAQAALETVYLLEGDASGLGTVHEVVFDGSMSSVIFPDVNGDGLADAVGTDAAMQAISVRLAEVDREFAWGAPVRYSVGYLPRALGLIELPGVTPGIPDLLCANSQDLSILVGVGEGVFRGALGFPTLAAGPRAVKTADLDNDGDLDVVCLSADQDAVSFMEGFGDGTLVTRTTVPLVPAADETPIYLSIFDLDGDGLLDVLITIFEADELRILRNPGTVGGFTEPGPADIYFTGDEPSGVAAADFNSDGLLDVVVGNAGDESLQIMFNMGNGQLDPQLAIPIGLKPAAVRCMDFDNDGNIDVAMTTGDVDGTDEDGDRFLVVLQGDGQGNLTARASYPIDAMTISIDFGDLDGNDFVDIVVAPTGYEYDSIYVFLNRDNFAFSTSNLVVGSGPANVVVADIDQDEDLDLICPTGYGELRFAFGDGEGAFPDIEPSVRGELPLLLDTLSVSYADMNGDDLPDLVMVSHFAPMVWVALNTSVEVSADE
jgi:hypothetical protein